MVSRHHDDENLRHEFSILPYERFAKYNGGLFVTIRWDENPSKGAAYHIDYPVQRRMQNAVGSGMI